MNCPGSCLHYLSLSADSSTACAWGGSWNERALHHVLRDVALVPLGFVGQCWGPPRSQGPAIPQSSLAVPSVGCAGPYVDPSARFP